MTSQDPPLPGATSTAASSGYGGGDSTTAPGTGASTPATQSEHGQPAPRVTLKFGGGAGPSGLSQSAGQGEQSASEEEDSASEEE